MRKSIIVFLLIIISGCSVSNNSKWDYRFDEEIMNCSVIDGGAKLVVLTDQSINILDMNSGNILKQGKGLFNNARSLVCMGSTCWIGGGIHLNGYLLAYDSEVGKVIRRSKQELVAEVNKVAFVDDGRIVSVHGDETIVLWDEQKMQPLKSIFTKEGGEIYSVLIINGKVFAGNDKGELIVTDVNFDAVERLVTGKGPIFSIFGNEEHLLLGGWEYLYIVNPIDFADKHIIPVKKTAISSCESSVSQQKNAWCGLTDGSLILIDFSSKKIKSDVSLHADEIRFIGGNNELIVTASKDGIVKAWERTEFPSIKAR